MLSVCALTVVSVGERAPRMPVLPASVVLITLDTTRADRLPPHGNLPLPAIDGLARDGVVFDRAVAPVPLSLPSHASLFTGRLPQVHGARVNGATVSAGLPLLAEQLHAAGFSTGAFVGSVVLNRSRGLERGFDVYDDVVSPTGFRRLRRPAHEVVDAAVGWVNTLDSSPFFLWVHLFDAHAPYAMPEAFDASPDGDPYNGAIAIMDGEIGRLLNALEHRGRLERTAVIVTADHGESLGDHGERGHGIFVYESAVRVPLIIRWPGIAPRRVGDLAQLIDLAPTVLALQGFTAPPMDGVSLARVLQGRYSDGRFAYAESMYPLQHGWSALQSVRQGRYKFIEAPRPELYDLVGDPGEVRNLYEKQPAIAAQLQSLLRTFGPAGLSKGAPADGASRDRLAALGYTASSTSPSNAVPAIWPDPKDTIGVYNELTEQRMKQRDR
ncbi:MAG TPA: sulfatase [Vicinamibacterales bacterium]